MGRKKVDRPARCLGCALAAARMPKNSKRSRGETTAEKFSELVLARRHDRAVEYAAKHGSVGTAACQQLPGSGESLLHIAARTRGTPVQLIDVLVRRGSCVNAADARGARPLHVAATGESVRAIFAAASAHGQVVDRDVCTFARRGDGLGLG